MSERLTSCPKCKSINISIINVHNPNTFSMNSKATLLCNHCNNEWEDLIASKHFEEQKRKEYII